MLTCDEAAYVVQTTRYWGPGWWDWEDPDRGG